MRYHMVQPRFVEDVLTGVKTSTIRKKPKRAQDTPQVGERRELRMWEDRPYTSRQLKVREIVIERVSDIMLAKSGDTLVVYIDRVKQTVPQCIALAKQEGFRSFSEMTAWFFAAHDKILSKEPLYGNLIEWKP